MITLILNGGRGTGFLDWIPSIIHSFCALKTKSKVALTLHRSEQGDAALGMQTEEHSPTDQWDFQADQMLSFR